MRVITREYRAWWLEIENLAATLKRLDAGGGSERW